MESKKDANKKWTTVLHNALLEAGKYLYYIMLCYIIMRNQK